MEHRPSPRALVRALFEIAGGGPYGMWRGGLYSLYAGGRSRHLRVPGCAMLAGRSLAQNRADGGTMRINRFQE